jgi:ribosomal protein S18 acetylase RimI-like enzyme
MHTILTNPIWHSLTSHHADIALGDDLARRYPYELSPFGAVVNHDQAALDRLVELIPSGQNVSIFSAQSMCVDAAKWTIRRQMTLIQMIYDTPAIVPTPTATISQLTNANVPAMRALVALTHPGPFMPRTIELGRYLAIWQAGQIAAMAGERMHPTGYREISAVCTHPDFQRRGYAKQLILQLAHDIQRAGELPFLHVASANASARALYEALGFKPHLELTVNVLKRL